MNEDVILCKALQIWQEMSDNEKAAVRFGMIPAERAATLIHSMEIVHDSARIAAVAFMECAKRDGGMVC